MNPTRRFRTILAAAAVALLVPTVASAEPTADDGTPPVEDADGSRAKAGKNRPAFPMAGDEFTSRIDKRLKRIGARLTKRLERANIPEKVKNQIRADYQKGATAVRRAAAKAAADGTVTKEEAKKVRQVANKVKQQAKKKWAKKAKQQRQGQGKGQGKGKAKGMGNGKGPKGNA